MKKQFWTLIPGSFMVLGLLFTGTASAASIQDQTPAEHGPQKPPDIRDTRVRDSKRQLAHLSKKLKLNDDQKLRVRAILSDRDRQIDLIHESESLPDKSKGTRIRMIVVDSNMLVENMLNNNQKQKFEAVLARQSRRKDRDRQA